MAAQKEKTLGYWLGVVLAIISLLGMLSAGAVQLSDQQKKTEKIPGVEWDMRVVKGMLRSMNPAKYDSVVATEVELSGQRPQGVKP
jgi:cytoskeletal protein RodZ